MGLPTSYALGAYDPKLQDSHIRLPPLEIQYYDLVIFKTHTVHKYTAYNSGLTFFKKFSFNLFHCENKLKTLPRRKSCTRKLAFSFFLPLSFLFNIEL